MDAITKAFKKLFSIGEDSPIDKSEVDDFQNLAEIFQSPKYTNTNSDTAAIEKLLAAIQSDDPTQAGPILEPTVEWEKDNLDQKSTSEKKETLLISKGIEEEEKPSSTNDESKDKTAKELPKSEPLFDAYRGSNYKNFLGTQLELLRILQEEYDNVMPAPREQKSNKFGKDGCKKFVLRKYDIPKWVMHAIEDNSIGRLDLKDPINSKNYVNRFQTLLWLEEAHQAIAMRRYDMRDVLLAKYQTSSFIIKVPGLAEGRPSLMRGDTAFLKSSQRSSYYEGYICEVRENEVIINTHSSLHAGHRNEGLVFDVHFVSSRTPFRRCHHGIERYRDDTQIQALAFPMTRLNLHPAKVDVPESPDEMRCFMRDLNIYQRVAVCNIIKNRCRPCPYILFGPPGTGKTVTFVECVFQIYARMSNSKILICANSNASADLIAQRIYDRDLIKKDELVRVSAFYRYDQDIIPEEVKPITKHMDMISSSEFARCRVVITTCIQAGALYEFGDKFDYVFIDEAGHANEAESMIALGLMKPGGGCALAGDPHQLGPVCISDAAKRFGLGLSLLERIFNRACYSRKKEHGSISALNPDYITKLIISYRCDPRLMVVNNKLFYDNELTFVTETPKLWLDVVKSENPLIFHSVKGRDRREYLNPSWFNANEAIKCMLYVNNLYRAGLQPEQLGIITPYRRQIDKFKTLFESLDLKKCKIATMEEFQGDEREVIIISTVRSNPRNLQFDKNFNLGFLMDPKRFNVGISRAKWLVIVVGDKDLLLKDPCWVEYMKEANNLSD